MQPAFRSVANEEEKMPNVSQSENRRALATAVLVIAFVAALLFSLPAHAGAKVFVCPAKTTCTELNARIVFIVPVTDDRLPTACLTAASTKTAEVADMIGSDEQVRIQCDRK